MTLNFSSFKKIYCVDFEFGSQSGELPTPRCVCVHELRSGEETKVWLDGALTPPPYDLSPDSLFIAYYALAELSCHHALGWPLPAWVVDLYVEFRNLTNGTSWEGGYGLLGALKYFGEPALEDTQKEAFRNLALRDGPYTDAEQEALMDYCIEDVRSLARLFPHFLNIHVSQALYRGDYLKALSHVELFGIPIDVSTFHLLQEKREDLCQFLIQTQDTHGIYDGLTFKSDRFERWVVQKGYDWPKTPTGQLKLDANTFEDMGKGHSDIEPLRQLRKTLAQIRGNKLALGADGRNRTMLSPFASKTGRNQPSNSCYIFGFSAWARRLITPQPGFGLAYIDWEQQEFGIAAALSGDTHMMEAYQSGDPYLTFAKQAGAVPADATKQSHPQERTMYKEAVLAVQYGMKAQSLSKRLKVSQQKALHLLRMFQRTYHVCHQWMESQTQHALEHGFMQTVFGWRLNITWQTKLTTLGNFPMQAHGAEMLRLAIIYGIAEGVRICAPIHDALLIEASLDRLQTDVDVMRECMKRASRDLLGGFELRTDTQIITHPNRYEDEKGAQMWDLVFGFLTKKENTPNIGVSGTPYTDVQATLNTHVTTPCTPMLTPSNLMGYLLYLIPLGFSVW